jgi:hypothetical protein
MLIRATALIALLYLVFGTETWLGREPFSDFAALQNSCVCCPSYRTIIRIIDHEFYEGSCSEREALDAGDSRHIVNCTICLVCTIRQVEQKFSVKIGVRTRSLYWLIGGRKNPERLFAELYLRSADVTENNFDSLYDDHLLLISSREKSSGGLVSRVMIKHLSCLVPGYIRECRNNCISPCVGNFVNRVCIRYIVAHYINCVTWSCEIAHLQKHDISAANFNLTEIFSRVVQPQNTAIGSTNKIVFVDHNRYVGSTRRSPRLAIDDHRCYTDKEIEEMFPGAWTGWSLDGLRMTVFPNLGDWHGHEFVWRGCWVAVREQAPAIATPN